MTTVHVMRLLDRIHCPGVLVELFADVHAWTSLKKTTFGAIHHGFDVSFLLMYRGDTSAIHRVFDVSFTLTSLHGFDVSFCDTSAIHHDTSRYNDTSIHQRYIKNDVSPPLWCKPRGSSCVRACSNYLFSTFARACSNYLFSNFRR